MARQAIDVVGTGDTLPSAFGKVNDMTTELCALLASGDTEDFTADDTLTTAETGKHCTNIGAVVAVTLTAPASPVIDETTYTLERVDGYAFRFKPGSGHTVNGGTADKYVEIQSTGLLTFRYIRSGEWVIVNDSALWNFEP